MRFFVKQFSPGRRASPIERKRKFGAGPKRARAESGLSYSLAVVAAVITGIATVIAAVVAATAIAGKLVLAAAVMIAAAGVASPVARLVAVEVVEGLFAALRVRSAVAVAGVIAVVDMAVEVAGAAVPVAGADEHSTLKPFGAVVAVGRAVIGSVVVVAVRADWLDSEMDGDLGRRYARGAKQGGCENCESEEVTLDIDLSLMVFLRGRSFACGLCSWMRVGGVRRVV